MGIRGTLGIPVIRGDLRLFRSLRVDIPPHFGVTKPDSGRDFEVVFRGHYDRIAHVIARVVGDRARAEELAVEMFWRLWLLPEGGADGLYELGRERQRALCGRWLRFGRAGEVAAQVRCVLARMNPRSAELLLLRNQDLSYAAWRGRSG